MNSLGKNIRRLRHQKGWSQAGVAKRLDLSIPAFSKIETGITDINLSRLEQICALFEVTVVQLLDPGSKDQIEAHDSDLRILRERLRELEGKIIELHRKMIDLHGEIHQANRNKQVGA